MLLIGLSIAIDLLAHERLARGRTSTGIADESGEISNQENDGVTHVLKVLKLADQHGVSEV